MKVVLTHITHQPPGRNEKQMEGKTSMTPLKQGEQEGRESQTSKFLMSHVAILMQLLAVMNFFVK